MNILVMNNEGEEVEVNVPDTITLTFKNPDVIYEAVRNLSEAYNIDENELTEIYTKDLSKWIRYGELISIEFNIVEKTANRKDYYDLG